MKQFFTILFLFSLCNYIAEAQQTPTFADPPGPEHVLVIYKEPTSPTDTLGLISRDSVKNYYQFRREIPEINILGLPRLVDTLVSDGATEHLIKLVQQGEIIRDTNNQHSATPTIHAWLYFNEKIAKPIANYLKNTYVNGTPLKDIIRFIVLCKGVPFRIDARIEDADSRGTNVICANLLTHLGETMEDPDALLFYYNKPPGISNPYFNEDPNFSMDHHFLPDHYQTTWQGRTIKLSYLVTHLSAPRFEDIQGMIDRSVNAINETGYSWFIDLDPAPCAAVSVGDPEPSFIDLDITNYFFDNTEQIYTSFQDTIMSYCSNGIWTTEGNPHPCYAWDYFQPDYIQSQLNFNYADGAFFSSIESHNGLSIGTFPVIRTRGQGLIADFTLKGGTVAVGQAFHSPGSSILQNSVYFPSYAVGYTFIEAAYLGLDQIDATNVVVGDPLTRIFYCAENIISSNTTIGSGDYTCDLIVAENATLTIAAGSTVNFKRNAKLKVLGTLELGNNVVLNFDGYSHLDLQGGLIMNGTFASLNFNDRTTLKINNVSVNNSLSITFNDNSELHINEAGTLTTYPNNLFTFNNNSKFFVNGKLIVNEGNSLRFNNNSFLVVNKKAYFNPGAIVSFNNNSLLRIYGSIKSLGELGNNVVFNLSGYNSQFKINKGDSVLIDFTTFNNNGLIADYSNQADPIKCFRISNSIFNTVKKGIELSIRGVTLETPASISNCIINNCSSTGIKIIQVPEIIIEHNSIQLSSNTPQLLKGIILQNNGVVNINDCIITGITLASGIESKIGAEEEIEIMEELETDITISQCTFEQLQTGILIDNQVAPYVAVNINGNHFDECKYAISVNDFFSYTVEITDNILSGSFDGFSEIGMLLTNGDEAIISDNSISNFLTGIELSTIRNPVIFGNDINASELTVNPLPGIIAVSSDGEIRANSIQYHSNGIELGSSSPKMGTNIITNNKNYGLYISDNSHPNLSETFIAGEKYPLSGYNTIRENGECSFFPGYSELYLYRSTVDLLKGCNTIADDREDSGLHCNHFYLIDGRPLAGSINAQRNYWGNHPVYGNDPSGRFGPYIIIDYEDFLSNLALILKEKVF